MEKVYGTRGHDDQERQGGIMQLVNGCIVKFETRGTDYPGGTVKGSMVGKVMKTAPEGVYVTTGMAVWIVPFRSILDCKAPINMKAAV